MKVLVTGGSGFIGSHVVEHYQDVAGGLKELVGPSFSTTS